MKKQQNLKAGDCSALGGESEVIARNFLDFPHEASRKKALPWNTALGLSKGVGGN